MSEEKQQQQQRDVRTYPHHKWGAQSTVTGLIKNIDKRPKYALAQKMLQLCIASSLGNLQFYLGETGEIQQCLFVNITAPTPYTAEMCAQLKTITEAGEFETILESTEEKTSKELIMAYILDFPEAVFVDHQFKPAVLIVDNTPVGYISLSNIEQALKTYGEKANFKVGVA